MINKVDDPLQRSVLQMQAAPSYLHSSLQISSPRTSQVIQPLLVVSVASFSKIKNRFFIYFFYHYAFTKM